MNSVSEEQEEEEEEGEELTKKLISEDGETGAKIGAVEEKENLRPSSVPSIQMRREVEKAPKKELGGPQPLAVG